MISPKVSMFSFDFAAQTLAEVVNTVSGWLESGSQCRYIVPINVDVLLKSFKDTSLHSAIQDADLIIADGQPIVWGSRLFGKRIPERVCGSDLVPAIFEAAQYRPLRVFLLGAAPGVASAAAMEIQRRWSGVEVAGVYSPPIGFEGDPAECDRIVSRINDARVDVVVVGFGAPKQEVWVHRHQGRINAGVVICSGATIDFLALHKRRAPIWMQRLCVEWTYRLLSEPQRLAWRYARCAVIFPWVLGREVMRVGLKR